MASVENKTVLLDFGQWLPRGRMHGEGCEDILGVVHAHGDWRGVRGLASLADGSATGSSEANPVDGYVTAGYAHVYSKSQEQQDNELVADGTVPANWYREDETQSDVWESVTGMAADDATYAVIQMPTNEELRLDFDPLVADPNTGDITLYVRYRTPNADTVSIRVRIYEGASTEVHTFTLITTTSEEWVTEELTATIAPTDWQDLSLGIRATATGDDIELLPISTEEAGGWTTDDTSLHEAMDADDAETAHSKSLEATQTDTLKLLLSSGDGPFPTTVQDFVLDYKLRATQPGVTATVKLTSEGEDILSAPQPNAPLVDTAYQEALGASEVIAINEWGTLNVEIEASYPEETDPTETTDYEPFADSQIFASPGGHYQINPTSNYYQEIDADDANEVAVNDPIFTGTESGSYEIGFEVHLEDPLDPKTGKIHAIQVKARGTNDSPFGTMGYHIELYQGAATEIADFTGEMTANNSVQTIDLNLSEAQANAITSYADLRLRIRFACNSDARAWVRYAKLVVPDPVRVVATYARLDGPSDEQLQVSWAHMLMDAATSSTSQIGDAEDIYVGDRYDIWCLDNGETELARRLTGMGQTELPDAWDFCSFGDDAVIATNYVDPVQVRHRTAGVWDANFSDLITSTEKPKARFCAMFRNYLLLANINLANHFADEVWISAFEDETDFVTIPSDYARIVSAPGEITGLVGGDTPIVFKRRSMHALQFTGSLDVFRPRLISDEVGTPYPKSIVQANGLLYWNDGVNFRVSDGRSHGEPISPDHITRWMSDSELSPTPLRQGAGPTSRDESLRITGAYDPQTQNIIWAYQSQTETQAGAKIHALSYNVITGNWSRLFLQGDRGPNAPYDRMGVLFARRNVAGMTGRPLRGLLVGAQHYDSGAGDYWPVLLDFSDPTPFVANFKTKLRRLGEPGKAARVTGVQPIYRVDAGESGNHGRDLGLSLVVTAADDFRFLDNLRAAPMPPGLANERGIYPVDVSGHWFEFFLGFGDRDLESLLGLVIYYQDRGER